MIHVTKIHKDSLERLNKRIENRSDPVVVSTDEEEIREDIPLLLTKQIQSVSFCSSRETIVIAILTIKTNPDSAVTKLFIPTAVILLCI